VASNILLSSYFIGSFIYKANVALHPCPLVTNIYKGFPKG